MEDGWMDYEHVQYMCNRVAGLDYMWGWSYLRYTSQDNARLWTDLRDLFLHYVTFLSQNIEAENP